MNELTNDGTTVIQFAHNNESIKFLLENGADIYTVSKRLGHKEIRTTEIYTKIIDEKMKEAANLIPELDLVI